MDKLEIISKNRKHPSSGIAEMLLMYSNWRNNENQ
jgi:hypothetical protein